MALVVNGKNLIIGFGIQMHKNKVRDYFRMYFPDKTTEQAIISLGLSLFKNDDEYYITLDDAVIVKKHKQQKHIPYESLEPDLKTHLILMRIQNGINYDAKKFTPEEAKLDVQLQDKMIREQNIYIMYFWADALEL